MDIVRIGVHSGATTTELGYARAYSLYKAAGFDSVDMNLNNKLKNETAFRAGDFDKADCLFDHPLEEIPQVLLLPWLKHICTIGQCFRTFFR